MDAQHEQQCRSRQCHVDVAEHHWRCVDEVTDDDRHEHQQENADEQQVKLHGVGDHDTVLDVAENERVGAAQTATDHEHRDPGDEFRVHREERERYVAEQGHGQVEEQQDLAGGLEED